MSVLVTVAILAALGAWCAIGYNRLIATRRLVTHAWRQVDAQVKRRHDLVSALVDHVKAAAMVDLTTVDAVTVARRRAMAAKGPADAGRKEGELAMAVGALLTLTQQDSTLATDPRLRALRDELTGATDAIASASGTYNTIATKYNDATGAIPGNIISGLAGFKRAELYA